MIDMDAANAIESAIDAKIAKAASKETRTTGKVTRIDSDGTVFVMLQGSDIETPVKHAAAAVEPDEEVTVTISGGSMSIDGNYSRPATDDRAAKAAQLTADAAVQNAAIAADAAATAVANAEIAQEAAISAQNSLKSVVQGATTVEKAVSVMQTALEAMVDYDPDEDEVTEYFWHDANGAHVLGDTSGYRNDIDSTGMTIVEVGTERSAAHFGADGATIGKVYDAQALDNESHMELDYHSLQLIDKEGDAYFYVSDLRDATGKATITDTFVGDGSNRYFTLSAMNASEIMSATVGGQPASPTLYNLSFTAYVEFSEAPAAFTEIEVTYTTEIQNTKAYTLGIRANGRVGMMSVAEGVGVLARGYLSHAEGEDTKADGRCSHVEGDLSEAKGSVAHAEGGSTHATGARSHSQGYSTSAQGENSHAEGESTAAVGKNSHAQNLGTRASSSEQTALGKYNVEDVNGTYAAIIGNGTSNNARSNALAVEWNGNVLIAGDVKNMSGNAKYLPLSGGTVTGNITTKSSTNTGFLAKHDYLDAKQANNGLTETRWPIGVQVNDKNGLSIARFCTSVYTSGVVGASIYAYNYNTSGTQVGSGHINLMVDKSGNVTYDVTTPQAFRNAIGIGAYGSLTEQSSTLTLTTSWQKIPLSSSKFVGQGCSVSSNGLKVASAGTYMIWGSMYLGTGYTVNDTVHLGIYKTTGSASSQMYDWRKRVYNANPSEVFNAGPIVLTLAANDVIDLRAYNQGGSRGTINSLAGAGLVIKRIA